MRDVVADRFGRRILTPDGEVNRGALGRIVFADATELQWLERLVLPLVSAEFVRWRDEHERMGTPLLVHANTNDEDVNGQEVERLIAALQAAGKKFEHRIYTNAPGGHLFNRLDTAPARDSRAEIWRFLAHHLHPPRKVK